MTLLVDANMIRSNIIVPLIEIILMRVIIIVIIFEARHYDTRKVKTIQRWY